MNLTDFRYLTTTTNNPIWYKDADCRYPLICPKGTRIKFVDVFVRFFNETWFKVDYNGETYYIDPEYCDGNVIVKTQNKSNFNFEMCRIVTQVFLTDRYGKQYVMNESGEINPL